MKPLVASLGLHVVVMIVLAGIGLFTARTSLLPTPKLHQDKPIQHRIRVDVLALPELRRLMNPTPTKSASVEKPENLVALPNPNVKKEVSIKSKPQKPKASKTKQNKPPVQSAFVGKTRHDLLKALRAGNRLQKGALVTEVSIGVATDRVPVDAPFWEILKNHIAEKWRVFSHFKGRELSTRVLLTINEQGAVTGYRVLTPSVSRQFDDYIQNFIEETLSVDIPIPHHLQNYLKTQGIAIIFEP